MTYIGANELESDDRVFALRPLTPERFSEWKSDAPETHRAWVENAGFKASPGQHCALPAADGGVSSWLFGMEREGWLYQLSGLPTTLPGGTFRLECDWGRYERLQACLGWGLASYRFERYKTGGDARPRLVLEDDIAAEVQDLCEAHKLVRDLVNTPTEHMGPDELAGAVIGEADRFGAECSIVKGEELLTRNFPAIHAVGRASTRAPRLIELSWGEENAPLVALVGKGVCFDTGGLDLKSATGMALMKKDMGGAAHALAVARLVMTYQLPVRLRLLIPAVENSVAGNAYRPGDVIPTRKGLSVEIGNTDAEGRVILSDALACACESDPDLVIDFATLTGAARVALGTDLPALFSNRPAVARGIQESGDLTEDPVWTMPLWQPYRKQIESTVADLNNAGKSSYGGCITAALFLESFVRVDVPWAHIDTFAWNESSRPGRPLGGEALGLRAVFHYLQARYD